MKKKLIIIAVILAVFFSIFIFTPVFAPHDENITKAENVVKEENTTISKNETSVEEEEITPSPYVSYNQWLKVEKTSLKNSKNENFTLKGISSHGLQWYSDILTYNNLKRLKDTWKINVFRLAMYTDENGYISKKEETKNTLKRIVKDLVDLDMYVIIDWHILKDNNPNIYKEDAKKFFSEISELYKNTPNVIYEICNEPNGNNVNWSDVKSYAEEVIPIIRKNSPNSLIIVGTPFWCQQLQPAADNPLKFDNLLYSCHFYAGTHKQNLRDEVSKALAKNLPIIISEFGTTDASGNGKVDIEESKKWIKFLNEKNISYINWSFAYKNESSALLLENYSKHLSQDFNNYLSESGKFIKSVMTNTLN